MPLFATFGNDLRGFSIANHAELQINLLHRVSATCSWLADAIPTIGL